MLECNPLKLKFHGCIFLVASSRGCAQQVLRVRPMEFGERYDSQTNGQHYTAADRRPTNQVSAWQAERGSRPTRRQADILARILVRMSACRVERVGEDITRMFRRCYTRKLLLWSLSLRPNSHRRRQRDESRQSTVSSRHRVDGVNWT